MTNPSIRERIFISYSHRDREWLERIVRMLKPAINDDSALDIWSDTEIKPGDEWKQQIEDRLSTANIALLLVSPYFLSSEFILSVELPAILDAATNRGLKIFWVPLSAAIIAYTPIGKYQCCCPPEKPLDSLPPYEQNKVIRDICYQIYSHSDQLIQTSAEQRDQLKDSVQRLIPEYLAVTINETIGGGDYSVVYAGTLQERLVAIKVLVDSPVQEHTENFKKTAALAEDYLHPCFVRIRYASFTTKPQFLIMDYVQAPSIADLIEQNYTFSIDAVAMLIQGLAEALSEYHRHDAGAVYGPLFSDNVYLDGWPELPWHAFPVGGTIYPEASPDAETGSQNDIYLQREPRLCIHAFGISSHLAKGDCLNGYFPKNWRAATYIGPEQYYGYPYSQESDQYALGLLAFEMLQGAPHVTVRCPADLEKKRKFFRNPAALAGDWQERQPELARIIFRMLSEHPDNRWPSLYEIARELEDLEQEHIVIAKQSYSRQCQGRLDFYVEFYRRFFERCPEAQQLFGKNMQQQLQKLDRALQFLLNFQEVSEPTILQPILQSHRLLTINEGQFDEFAAALIDTLRVYRGENAQVIRAWQQTIRPGMAYLQQHCCSGNVPHHPKPATRLHAKRTPAVAPPVKEYVSGSA